MANLNVRNLLDSLKNAILEIEILGEEYDDSDLRRIGLSNDNIEIFKERENIPEDLIVPITFIPHESGDMYITAGLVYIKPDGE